MLKRVFVDIESTGDGTSLQHDIVEIYCEMWFNHKLVDTFDDKYCHTNSTIFSGGINRKKAEENKANGCDNSEVGLQRFIAWLKSHLGEDEKAFFIAYGCEWDFTHIKNWFKRNKETKRKYFYTPGLCVMQLMAVKTGRWLSLEKAAVNFNIPVNKNKLHTAIYDAQLCRHIFFKLEGKLKI